MPGPTSFFDDNGNAEAGLVAKGKPGDNSAPLTITEISGLLKRTVEDRFGHVRLRGELSGVKRAASGHLYCCLKDEGATIDGVMWRTGAQRLGFVPEDGIEIVATGKLTTYPGRSKYQVVIDSMEIAGEGALLALLEKTRKRLEAEGLFAGDRKRALPFMPRVIGVVTSPTGAVIRDILHRLADRCPTHVLVWPVLVQGNGAAAQVAAAIEGFNGMAAGGRVPRPDLLIVARGGGSIEDLWAFNEEPVVRAIAGSAIPVISAVGHETDTTLADFAADMRAPTPTAAAEIAVPVLRELAATLDEYALRQRRCALRPVALGRERLQARVARLPRPEALAAAAQQRLDDLGDRLRRGLADQATHARHRLQDDAARLSLSLLRERVRSAGRDLNAVRLRPALLTRELESGRQRLAALDRVRRQLDPDAPLERGFARVSAPGLPLVKSSTVAVGQERLTLKFSDGLVEVIPTAAAPAEAPPAPPRRKPARSPGDAATQQPKLL
ncbi:exodeoxyribonuclease VII large subunit [Croceibacterium sp. TMG7-5b_MA50]|uniref:exodeoxyribonuclease VII large subunit n=1 Tax=Croceibacterium sp. TMG7-5b_MA50 TaxID=3121290 RepID=UPI003222141A